MEHQLDEDGVGCPAVAQMLRRLARVDGLPVARAAGALTQLLARLRASTWPEVAWCFSSLTASGFPVEFAFASHGQEIRYTCEVTGPETPEQARLPVALALLAALEAGDPRTLLPEWLPAMQQHSPADLRYGAWLSGRHDAQRDRYKLYAEVLCGDAPVVRDYVTGWLGQDSLLQDRNSTLRMIGVEPATGRVELYFRIHHLELHHLYPLLAHVGCRAQAGVLVDFFQTHRRWPEPFRLPGNETGVSYAFVQGVDAPTCTLFVPAARLWGRDEQIRAKVLGLSEEMGWEMAGYRAVAAEEVRHGLVGVSVGPVGVMGLGVGVSGI